MDDLNQVLLNVVYSARDSRVEIENVEVYKQTSDGQAD